MKISFGRIQAVLERYGFYYPFTITGSALTVLGLVLLVRSLIIKDPYELLLSIAALFVLAALVLLGRLQAGQFAKLRIQWDSSAPVAARSTDSAAGAQKLTGVALSPFLWYRLHFSLRGTLTAGRGATMFVSHDQSAVGRETIPLELSLPVCGSLDAHGYLSIGDIFGLTRSRFGRPFQRIIAVQPAVFPEPISVHVEAAERTEEKQSQLNSDEDKYYMREYAPGDRFRDINWKTSSRLLQLYTRISPIAQEQTKIIALDFRNYREAASETLESVTHLNHIKSWLLSFLRTVKGENRDFHFHVTTARGLKRLETREDIERFAEELATMPFQSDPGHLGELASTDEIYIFTTPYDKQLPALLHYYPQRRINVYRTLSASWQAGSRRRQLPLFDPKDHLPLPGFWALRREPRLSQPTIEHSAVGIVGQEVVEPRLF